MTVFSPAAKEYLANRQNPTCVLTGPQIIRFPDGELIRMTADTQYYAWPVEPFTTVAADNSFIELNYLMRPPFSDDEIRLMPVQEVISLYYSLRKIVRGYEIQPDPVVSAGLGQYGAFHEFNLQSRIFALRPELMQVQLNGKYFRVLVPPHLLDPPPPPDGFIQGSGIASIFIGLIPIVGLAFTAASVAYTINDTLERLKAAGKAASLINEIQNGIEIAKQTVHDPSPDVNTVNRLRQADYNWQSRVKQVTPLAYNINIQGVHACGPATVLIDSLGGVGKYVADWKPRTDFFFSDTVKQMVYAGTKAPSISAESNAPAAAGLGIGALLLLLL